MVKGSLKARSIRCANESTSSTPSTDSMMTTNSSPPKWPTNASSPVTAFEAIAEGEQQIVAGGVAEAVVHDLEPVEVEQQDGRLALAFPRVSAMASSSRSTIARRFGKPVR